jgi:hypothetical protein
MNVRTVHEREPPTTPEVRSDPDATRRDVTSEPSRALVRRDRSIAQTIHASGNADPDGRAVASVDGRAAALTRTVVTSHR